MPIYCLAEPQYAQDGYEDLVKQHPNIGHPYNPNYTFQKDPDAEMYWLQFADFFEWPHVQYFDDTEDLVEKIKTADLKQIHENMKKESKILSFTRFDEWCKIISNM